MHVMYATKVSPFNHDTDGLLHRTDDIVHAISAGYSLLFKKTIKHFPFVVNDFFCKPYYIPSFSLIFRASGVLATPPSPVSRRETCILSPTSFIASIT